MLIHELESVANRFEQQIVLCGQSKSKRNNYIRGIASFVVHFRKLSELIDPDEINEYLIDLVRKSIN